MRFQISCEGVNSDVNEYIVSNCEMWDLIPGLEIGEKNFETFDELYDFIEECESRQKGNLAAHIEILEKAKPEDEKMFLCNIYAINSK